MTGDMGALEDGPMLGTTDLRPGPVGTRRTPMRTLMVVVAVVVILLTANLVALDRVLLHVGDDDGSVEDQPWNATVAPQVIGRDTTWTGRTGVLERPVRVDAGARLRLVDCDLELRIEDMLTFRCPYFEVDEGGSLEIVRSNITLTEDPWLWTSIIGPESMSRHLPFLSRVVNLNGTTEPVLGFDLKWMGEPSVMAVAVQDSPVWGLERVFVTDPEEVEPHAWTHYEVPLRDFAGKAPRVVIFFEEFPRSLVLVHDLQVTDGGEAPSMDSPWTGVAAWDWEKGGTFVEWKNTAEYYGSSFADIIRSRGELMLSDASITAPAGLPRYPTLNGGWLPDSRGNPPAGIYNTTRDGWCTMVVEEGALSIEGSTITNVPVAAMTTVVDVDGSSLASDCDMMAIEDCTGSVTSTRFEFTGPPSSIDTQVDQQKAYTALGIGDTGPHVVPFVVRDCTFVDTMLGLDMGHANVAVAGCTFRRATRAAVWDHDSQGFGGWDGLQVTNAFEGCTGDLYIRTSTGQVEFTGPSFSFSSVTFRDMDGAVLGFLEPWPRKWLGSAVSTTVHLIVPKMIVGHDAVERRFAGLVIEVQVSLQELEVRVDIDDLPAVVSLSDLVAAQPYVSRAAVKVIDVEHDEVLDEYRVDYMLTGWYGEADWFAANISIDGEPVRSVNLSVEALVTGYHYMYFNQTVDPTHGPVEVTVDVMGVVDYGEWGTYWFGLASATDQILVVDNGTTTEQVREAVASRDAVVAMAPNVTAAFDGLRLDGPKGTDAEILLIGETGAKLSLVFEGTAPGYVYVNHTGPADLELGGITASRLRASYYGYSGFTTQHTIFAHSRMLIHNASVGELYAYIYDGNLSVTDSVVAYGMAIYASTYGNISLERVDVVGSLGASIQTMSSRVKVADCHFSSELRTPLKILSNGITKIEVLDTAFDGSSLWVSRVHHNAVRWSLDVRGCDFRGSGAALLVLPEREYVRYGGDDPRSLVVPSGNVSGNTFWGEGTGAILHPALVGAVAANNSFRDGARLFVDYRPDVALLGPEGSPADARSIYRYVEDGRVSAVCPLFISGKVSLTPQWNENPSDVFIDLTDDLERDFAKRPLVIYVLYDKEGRSGLVVVDFLGIDPREASVELAFMTWPDVEPLLIPLLRGWPWPMPRM